MLKIDKPIRDTPFYGLRQMTGHLHNEGSARTARPNRRLMRLSPGTGCARLAARDEGSARQAIALSAPEDENHLPALIAAG